MLKAMRECLSILSFVRLLRCVWFRSFLEDASDLVLELGGSLSGEHGDGQSRAELLPKMFGDELVGAFREFKAIWDPTGMMNPGKVVDPFAIDDNLRLGADFRPPAVATHFAFPEDDGDFTIRVTDRGVETAVSGRGTRGRTSRSGAVTAGMGTSLVEFC